MTDEAASWRALIADRFVSHAGGARDDNAAAPARVLRYPEIDTRALRA